MIKDIRADFVQQVDMIFDETTNEFIQFSTISEPIQIIRTQRGKRKLLLDGYIYRLDRANDRGVEQWRCSKKNCRGRIHRHNSLPYSSAIERANITLISSHSHLSEPAQCEAAILVDHIRTSAQHNLHESPKDIVTRLLRSVTDETAANLPSMTAMQRSIQRRRQQQKSFDSFSMNIEPLLTDEIEIFSHSITDHSLLNLTELGYNQILIITCDHEQQFSNSSIWLCTTLNEIKNDFLQCILIIQIFDDHHRKFLPMIYAFLPSNSNDFYRKLFNQLFSSQTPNYILTNCDPILIDSLNNFFLHRPLHIKICPILLHNELLKHLQQCKRSFDDNDYRSIKYLLQLTYSPQTNVLDAFEILQEISSSTIEGVYDRFEDLCVGRLRPNGQRSQPLFPMKTWNWSDVLTDFKNLLVINTSIQQWDELFRTSLSICSHRKFSKIIDTIQQLHQHQINSECQTIPTTTALEHFPFSQYQQTIPSYSLEQHLLDLIEYLPS